MKRPTNEPKTQRAPVEQGPLKLNYVPRWNSQIIAAEVLSEMRGLDVVTCQNEVALHDAIAKVIKRATEATAPDHAREGALRMFVWTKSPSWAAVVLAEHVTQARTLLLEEIGSSGDGSCPEREAAAKWVKEGAPVIWRGPNAEFALTDSAELREQEFHSEKLQRRVKELERALADGKEGGE